MTPFAARDVLPEFQDLVVKVRQIVEALPDLDLGQRVDGSPWEISCHTLCRGLADYFSLKCVDGHYAGYCQHSWIVLEREIILDPYPVALYGGPIICVAKGASPNKHLYRDRRSNYILTGYEFLFLEQEPFLTHAQLVTAAVRETALKLDLKP